MIRSAGYFTLKYFCLDIACTTSNHWRSRLSFWNEEEEEVGVWTVGVEEESIPPVYIIYYFKDKYLNVC